MISIFSMTNEKHKNGIKEGLNFFDFENALKEYITV
jgi:hypothetical protein